MMASQVLSVEEAIKLVKESQAMYARGNLHLHKFISNYREVLASNKVTECDIKIKNANLNIDILPTL